MPDGCRRRRSALRSQESRRSWLRLRRWNRLRRSPAPYARQARPGSGRAPRPAWPGPDCSRVWRRRAARPAGSARCRERWRKPRLRRPDVPGSVRSRTGRPGVRWWRAARRTPDTAAPARRPHGCAGPRRAPDSRSGRRAPPGHGVDWPAKASAWGSLFSRSRKKVFIIFLTCSKISCDCCGCLRWLRRVASVTAAGCRGVCWFGARVSCWRAGGAIR